MKFELTKPDVTMGRNMQFAVPESSWRAQSDQIGSGDARFLPDLHPTGTGCVGGPQLKELRTFKFERRPYPNQRSDCTPRSGTLDNGVRFACPIDPSAPETSLTPTPETAKPQITINLVRSRVSSHDN